MEPAQTKPLRKRRRWLIVAMALVLASLLSWWYWPRGDAKFVGKWSAQTSDVPAPGAIMTLSSNGSSYWTFPLKPGKTAYTFWELTRRN